MTHNAIQWVNRYPADKCSKSELHYPTNGERFIHAVDSIIYPLNNWDQKDSLKN